MKQRKIMQNSLLELLYGKTPKTNKNQTMFPDCSESWLLNTLLSAGMPLDTHSAASVGSCQVSRFYSLATKQTWIKGSTEKGIDAAQTCF